MKVEEYAGYDGVGLASLVRSGQVTPGELAKVAEKAINATNSSINAVIEIYTDRLDGPGPEVDASGPLHGVPVLIKDAGGHEKGRLVEYGSRLCAGMKSESDTNLARMMRKAGLNIIGRSNVPEYCIAATTENLLYGDTCTPWKPGYSAGGSSGGAAAAVAAGMVPIAHGSDIGGSLRIPASWSGAIGLKPSRGLISAGPDVDEDGMGLSMNFVQTKSMRDTAVMLDALSIPQPGDPFVISRPEHSYSHYLRQRPRLRIGWTAARLADMDVDPVIATRVGDIASMLADEDHKVEQVVLPFDHERASRMMAYYWFFGFARMIDQFAYRTGHHVGPHSLEAVVLGYYRLSRSMQKEKLLEAIDFLNATRKSFGEIFSQHDVLLTPTTAIPPPPNGKYGLNIDGYDPVEYLAYTDRPVQFCFPFNVIGAAALSLPLGMHPSGLPFGLQFAAANSNDHLLMSLGAEMEDIANWHHRIPPIHASQPDLTTD